MVWTIKKKAQATLEFTVAFVIMAVLLFSLLNIWMKFAKKIVKDERDYYRSRVESGAVNIGLGDPISSCPGGQGGGG